MTTTSARSPARPQTAPGVTAWRNAVFTIFGLSGFAYATWAARLPDVRRILHADTQTMGVLVAGIAVGSVLGLLGSSHLVARLGATGTIRLCYSVAAAGLLAVGVDLIVAPSFWVLFGLLAVFGAGSSIVDVAMNLSGAANERAAGRALMPLFHAVFSLGTVLGAGVGALLALLRVPVGVTFTVVGAAAIVVTLVLVRFLQPAEAPVDESTPAGGWRTRLGVWRRPRVLLIGLIVLGAAFAEGSANDWLAQTMVLDHGLEPAAGAAIFGVFVAAMTIGRVGGVKLLDRFGRVPVLRVSAAVAVTGLLVVILVPVTWIVVAGTVLWGFGAALGFPIGMSAAADDPATATESVSAVATTGYLAFLVGPPVIGFLGQQIGLSHALTVVLVLVLLGGLCAPAARPVARPA